MTASDRHPLFGLLALQNGLIDQVQLIAAFQAWTRDKSRSLADHLKARGDLDDEDRAAVEALAARHLTRPRNGQAAEADDDQDPDRTAGLTVGAATGDGQRSQHQTAGFADAKGVLEQIDQRLRRQLAGRLHRQALRQVSHRGRVRRFTQGLDQNGSGLAARLGVLRRLQAGRHRRHSPRYNLTGPRPKDGCRSSPRPLPTARLHFWSGFASGSGAASNFSRAFASL
jgi:hypothetical protein